MKRRLFHVIPTRGLQVEELGPESSHIHYRCHSAGAKVAGILGVLDRQEGARENIESAGYKFEALFTTGDLGV
jgi:hypothetical protein